MDCFAEPVIGRAFARPVGSNDGSNCFHVIACLSTRPLTIPLASHFDQTPDAL